jgi:hypothetical protein
MSRAPASRSGKVVCQSADGRWSAEVRLYETTRGQTKRNDLTLHGTFVAETSATRAGEQVVAEWTGGNVSWRDLLLRQLAASYRELRQTYKAMYPPTVPATRAAWEGAIDAWLERGWMQPADAARCREQIAQAFEADAGAVKRHRLQAESERDGAG